MYNSPNPHANGQKRQFRKPHYPKPQGFKPHRIRIRFYDILASSIYSTLVDKGVADELAGDYVEAIMSDLSRDVVDFGYLKEPQQ